MGACLLYSEMSDQQFSHQDGHRVFRFHRDPSPDRDPSCAGFHIAQAPAQKDNAELERFGILVCQGGAKAADPDVDNCLCTSAMVFIWAW